MIVGADDFISNTQYSLFNITVHPKYNPLSGDYNIAVLRTRRQISSYTKKFSDLIPLYSLYNESLVSVYALRPDWMGPKVQETTVPTIYCWRIRESYPPWPSICAGYLNNTNTICRVSKTNKLSLQFRIHSPWPKGNHHSEIHQEDVIPASFSTILSLAATFKLRSCQAVVAFLVHCHQHFVYTFKSVFSLTKVLPC